jgi:predicted pyridoxine 5'-phosphate oxidase superfamily flavin-nucleotide-binding protein
MMHVKANAAATLTRTTKVKALVAHATSRNVVFSATYSTRPVSQPKVLRASLTVQPPAVVPVESILFIMPDANFDDSGRVVWSLSVWRVTVYHPVQTQVEGAISNSI